MQYPQPKYRHQHCAVAAIIAAFIFLSIYLDPVAQIAAAKWQADHPENFTYSIIGRT